MSGSQEDSIGLYFHIPFCTKKCAYCHFYVLPDKDPFKVQLLKGFHLEWERWLPAMQGRSVGTIYFGGGTPALIGASAIHDILSMIKRSLPFASENLEITLEANPENITPQLMRDYKAAGVNRVSIGLQSLNDQLLNTLGRIHSAEKAIESVWAAADAGISNISVDLIYDLPGQTLEIWQHSLDAACKLPITHLSLYNLTIEPHTVFFKYQKALSAQIPDPEVSLKMYENAIEVLGKSGLAQYEISAFAKPGYQARHNVGYWVGRPFLGFGPSAFSFWEGKRFRNVSNLSKYCKALELGKSPIDFEEVLAPVSSRRELLAIQLRLMAGVDLKAFQRVHGPLDGMTLEMLQHLQKEGLLRCEGDVWSLTRRGVLFYDTVAAEIV